MPFKDPELRRRKAREYQRRHYAKDPKAARAYQRQWRLDIIESQRPLEHAKNLRANAKARERAFAVLGGARCVNCGCEDRRILEINHVNGGGRQEILTKTRRGTYNTSYLVIRESKTGDPKLKFNVLCRVCNAAHYVWLRFGLQFKVVRPEDVH